MVPIPHTYQHDFAYFYTWYKAIAWLHFRGPGAVSSTDTVVVFVTDDS